MSSSDRSADKEMQQGRRVPADYLDQHNIPYDTPVSEDQDDTYQRSVQQRPNNGAATHSLLHGIRSVNNEQTSTFFDNVGASKNSRRGSKNKRGSAEMDSTDELDAPPTRGKKQKRYRDILLGITKIDPKDGLITRIDGSWYRAVYHHEYVEMLDFREIDPAQYAHRPAGGKDGIYDITSFLEAHESWGPSRADRPADLFELRKPSPQPELPQRGNMEVQIEGKWRMVLDSVTSNPIKDYPSLPLQVSTNIEGWRMENIFRLDPRIGYEQFRQRMLPVKTRSGEDARPNNNQLQMRRFRFRQRGRCISWEDHRYKSACDRYLMSQMTEESLKKNSTSHLKDLDTWDVKALEAIDSGKYPSLPGNKALKGDKRAKRDEEIRQAVREWDRKANKPSAPGAAQIESQPSTHSQQLEKTPSTRLQTKPMEDKCPASDEAGDVPRFPQSKIHHTTTETKRGAANNTGSSEATNLEVVSQHTSHATQEVEGPRFNKRRRLDDADTDTEALKKARVSQKPSSRLQQRPANQSYVNGTSLHPWNPPDLGTPFAFGAQPSQMRYLPMTTRVLDRQGEVLEQTVGNERKWWNSWHTIDAPIMHQTLMTVGHIQNKGATGFPGCPFDVSDQPSGTLEFTHPSSMYAGTFNTLSGVISTSDNSTYPDPGECQISDTDADINGAHGVSFQLHNG